MSIVTALRAAPLAALVLGIAQPVGARAQSPSEAIDAFASSWIESRYDRNGGNLAEWPVEAPRPASAWHIDSTWRPLRVHGEASVAVADGERALRALEATYDQLVSDGWGNPPPDGGRGGSSAFDVYLVDRDVPGEAVSDGPLLYGALDAVGAFGVVGARRAALVERRVAEAYADAVLLATEPAEAPGLRRGTAAWLAARTRGDATFDASSAAQLAPWQSYYDEAAANGRGGAVLFALLEARYGDGFVHALWDFARQRTQPGTALRGEPDLFQAFARFLDMRRERIEDAFEALALDRWSAATRVVTVGMEPMTVLDATYDTLPARSSVNAAPLAPYATEYARIDVRGAKNKRLRIWSEGEFGTNWSLAIARIDGHGRERSRAVAPSLAKKTRNYLVVELGDDSTEVIVAVTNLGPHPHDPDLPSIYDRSARIIVDRHPDDGASNPTKTRSTESPSP
ncbi:MAG: hypothetical protein R3A78_15465 [Polyangiales bacterium]